MNRMKMIKRKTEKLSAILLAFLLLVCTGLCGVRAFAAADSASFDPDQIGSITLTIRDTDGNTVAGADMEFTLYQVATIGWDADGNMAYTYTDAFASCGLSLEVLNEELSSGLALWAENQGLAGTTEALDENGTVVFENLTPGLYLIMQLEDAPVNMTVNPFAVSIPIEYEGEWLYDVDASPKVGDVTQVETTPEETTTKPEETTTSGEETTTAPGETTTVSEENTTAVEQTTTSAEETTTLAKLPQTGQLYWPIPLLAVIGLILLLSGRYLARQDGKETM